MNFVVALIMSTFDTVFSVTVMSTVAVISPYFTVTFLSEALSAPEGSTVRSLELSGFVVLSLNTAVTLREDTSKD